MWTFVYVLAVCFPPLWADVGVTITNHWNGGFQGDACFDITVELHSWTVTLTFDQVINSLEVWTADIIDTSADHKVYKLHNKDWNKDEHVGDRLCIQFLGHGDGDIVPTATASIEGLPDGGTGITAAPTASTSPGETPAPTPAPTTAKPLPPMTGDGVTSTLKINSDWGNRFDGEFDFLVNEDLAGWMINISYSKQVTKMDIFIGDAIYTSPDGLNWVVVDKGQDGYFHAGSQLNLKFFGNYEGGSPAPTGQAVLINMGRDKWVVDPAPTTDTTKYNYNDVLMKSIMFFETQRSGKLPASNRIPYRGDSALGDKGDAGEDLTGGWYDAGDHVKFNFPMAYSSTILAWGYLMYKDAYEAAGQADYLLDCIKWPLDYLLKCHTKPDELYVQVGDGGADHSYWGPPELMTMARPAYKITASKPGTDVAMETAAAFATGSLAFQTKDPAYSATLLQHAKQLWDFANTNRGIYSDSVQAAAAYYRSYNISDELCWGSLWLYQVTNDSKYLDVAERYFDPEPAWGMSWDDKTIVNQVLLYKLTKKDIYKKAVEDSFRFWFPGGSIPYTPKGLAYRLQWGSLRYSSNMAMAALVAADAGLHATEYRRWAMCQIHYALGDTGFSYLIGHGSHFPKSPHHRSSSCPNIPAPCGPFVMSSKEPNVHILYGALVGGPGQSDEYTDDRSNYVNNEVACDYNAGFQTAVAALKSLVVRKEHPEQTGNDHCPYTAAGNSG
ncbi:endoglucanase 4-like [Physella acuta]|uniref:endoglucanase 4-like n=1 Tax=Physella acuta TaxID=109671 RepID=UPI0027DB3F7E|nr:endoglucanase 4-like [Physella acuta]